jgi:hypothetical protein
VEVAVGVGVGVGDVVVGVKVGEEVATWRLPGMNSSWPMESNSLERLFSSMMAFTVVLNLRAMPLSVSPASTT